MPTYTVHQAKTQLSKLIAAAERGEEVIIARDDKPVVRLTLVEPKRVKRVFGAYKGEFTVPDSFFDPLPEEELKAWNEGPVFPIEEPKRPGRPKRRRRA